MIETGLFGAISLCISFFILLMRCPRELQLIVVRNEAITDIFATVGTFAFMSLFNPGVTALFISVFVGLIISGALILNRKFKLIEKSILKEYSQQLSLLYREKDDEEDPKILKKLNKKIKKMKKRVNKVEEYVHA